MAPQRNPSAASRRVWFLVLEGFEVLDLAGPLQVFETANTHGAQYDIHLISDRSSARSGHGGLEVRCEARLPVVAKGDLVLVPGLASIRQRSTSPVLLAWLSAALHQGAAMASVCSGAFVLGQAGLLDGLRCTTHWSLVEELAIRFPSARVQSDVLFVQDGMITTSAGVASGIDLALWFVESDLGPLSAAVVARDLVVFVRRDASHGQRSVYLEYRGHQVTTVHRAQDWLQSHFAESVPLRELAEFVGTSERHLSRQFKAATGLTPRAFQMLLRLDLAEALITDSTLTIEQVAARCGFRDARAFRREWIQRKGHSPSDFRRNLVASD